MRLNKNSNIVVAITFFIVGILIGLVLGAYGGYNNGYKNGISDYSLHPDTVKIHEFINYSKEKNE